MPSETTFQVELIHPGEFEPTEHWYPKALNAQIHPMVSFFMNLGIEKIINRYCHLNARVDEEKLSELLKYQPKHFLHAGADLFHVTDENGNRKMVVIETNSCPSGQKSMPLYEEHDEQGGYRINLESGFLATVRGR